MRGWPDLCHELGRTMIELVRLQRLIKLTSSTTMEK